MIDIPDEDFMFPNEDPSFDHTKYDRLRYDLCLRCGEPVDRHPLCGWKWICDKCKGYEASQ